MKAKVAIVICLLFVLRAHSQIRSGNNTSGTTTNMALFNFMNAEAQSEGMITGVSDISKHFGTGTRNRMELGATLLFNNWENSGKIVTATKEFLFQQIDVDLYSGTVLIKMNEKIFSFSTEKIKRILINDETYRILYDPTTKGHGFFQLVHQEDDFEIFKGFKLIFRKGTEHAMFSTGQKNTLRRQEIFYVKTASGLRKIKMSKKRLMKTIDEGDLSKLKEMLSIHKNRKEL